jgi:hypothetical protein
MRVFECHVRVTCAWRVLLAPVYHSTRLTASCFVFWIFNFERVKSKYDWI